MKTKNLGAVTAYADAVKQGYKGTREEFGTVMANFADSAAQVAADAQEIRETKENIEGMESNVQALQEQAAESAQAAEQSKTEAAGYADAAEVSRQAAAESEANVNAQVTGFEEQVTAKTEEAESDINTAKEAAVAAITKQQTDSIQAIKDQSATEQEKLETYSNQAKTAAENAAQSEQAAKTAKEAAESAKTAAETAKTQAEQAATKTAEDRTAVEAARETVTQTAWEVGENKEAVENTAQNFNLVYQQAVKDVNDAGQAQTERVQEAGNGTLNDIGTSKANALSAINAAGETQTKAVNDAGTAKTEAINAAGSTQVSAITKEGEMQVSNVQEAATEIIADREQIELNRQNLLKTAIKRTASGKTITLSDSAEMPFAGMRQYGWTKQETTTGAQLFDGANLASKTDKGITLTNNNDGSFTVSGTATEAGDFNTYAIYTHKKTLDLLKPGTIKCNLNDVLPAFEFQLRDKPGGNILAIVASNPVVGYSNSSEITQAMLDAEECVIYVYFYAPNVEKAVPGIIKPMLYQDGDGTWEPYTGGQPSPNPEYPQEFVSAGDKGSVETAVTGKNLINPNEIVIGGIVGSNGNEFAAQNRLRTAYIPVVANTTYTLSGHYYVVNSVHAYDKNMEWIKTLLFKENRRIDIPDNVKYIRINWRKSDESDFTEEELNAFKKLQIQMEEGTEATDYEPYTVQSLAYTTPNGLPGLPVSSGGNYTDENGQQWIANYRDWERGVDVQRVGKETFVGSGDELWIASGNYNKFRIELSEDAQADEDGFSLLFCTHFVQKNISYLDAQNILGCTIRFNTFYIKFGSESEITSEELLMMWIRDNPITLYYILATPIETPIPPEELAAYHALHTNHPNTTICNDEDVWMEVEYGIDTEASIDAKVQESNIMTDATTGKKYILGMKDGLLTVYEVIE